MPTRTLTSETGEALVSDTTGEPIVAPTAAAPQDAEDGQETADAPAASAAVSDSSESAPPAVADAAPAAAPPALSLDEAQAEFETWSRRRQELQAKVTDRTSQAAALEAVIAQARRDTILGKAELGATAPLVAERATLQAEIGELEELVTVAFEEEKAAQLLFGQAHAAARVVQLRDHAAQMVERATASDARIDTALAEFIAALEERYELYTEGQAFVGKAESGDAAMAEQGWPGVGPLDHLRVLPLDWRQIPHADGMKYPRHYRIEL